MEEIKYTLHARQMALPLALSTVLTLCSISCLVMAFSNPTQWTYWLLGAAGTLFFGSLAVRGVRQLHAKKPLLVLGDDGFTDYTLYNTPYTVAYGDMENIHFYTYRKKKFIGVNLTSEAEERFLEGQPEQMKAAFLANKKVSRFLINLPLDYISAPKGELEQELRRRAHLTDED